MKGLIIAALIITAAAPGFTQEKPLNVFRADYDGQYFCWLMHERSGWLVEVLASQEGWAEVDLGPALVKGNLRIYPLLGVDFVSKPAAFGSFIPQLYLFYVKGRVDLGSWSQYFIGPEDFLYFRDYLTLDGLIPLIGIGPQVEGTLGEGREVLVGGRIKYSVHPGDFNAFLGWDTATREGFFRLTYMIEF